MSGHRWLVLPTDKSFSEALSDLETGAWEGGCFLSLASLHKVPAVPLCSVQGPTGAARFGSHPSAEPAQPRGWGEGWKWGV